jgi:putative polyhydroxyalkanoate system protein
MPDIHLRRDHTLGLEAARALARTWTDQAREKFAMDCDCEAGDDADRVRFSRAGVSGTLHVAADHFQLDARLGFLLGAYKDRIEQEVGRNLDALLGQAGT